MFATGAVTVTFSGPAWSLHALNYDSQDGRTIGRADHVHLTVSSPSCSFVIDGSGGATADDAWIPFTHYNGDTFQLGGASGSKPGTMEAYDVSGCTGVVADGNPITLGYISTLSGDLTVTSP
jgi:type 1 fimbria pilin